MAMTAGSTAMAAKRHMRMPPPATSPNSATPMKSVSPAAKNAMAEDRALTVIPGPTLAAVSTRASSTPTCDLAELEISGDEVDVVVDSQAGQHGPEGAADDVQMADGQRRVAQRPDQAQQERAHRQQRMPHAAEAGDQHDEHAGEGEDRGQAHRRLAPRHLVVFHDRQAGQPDGHVGVMLP